MAQTLDPADLDVLLTFRVLAKEARASLEQVKSAAADPRMVGRYVETGNVLETYKPLCIPVRRAYRDSDRASFARVCHILENTEGSGPRLRDVSAGYDAVRKDLDSHTILNDSPLGHRIVFDAWMDAVIFGSFGGKDSAYRKLESECGKAVEGVAVRITEAIAERMLELDELVAEAVERSGT
jgi:hypothetical protein